MRTAFAGVLVLAACETNSPPNAPSKPSGPVTGVTGQSLRYGSSATDPDADNVSLRFDWDGDTTEWSPLLVTGTTWADTHSWQDPGTYQVQAQARDAKDRLSPWSQFLTVEIDSAEAYPMRVLATVPVGQQPSDVCATPDGQYAYVTCYGSSYVTVIRTADNLVVANVNLSGNPLGIAVSASGDRVFVACSDGRVKVITTAGNQVSAEVNLGLGAVPFGIAASADGERLYVTDFVFSRVLVVSTSTYQVEATVAVGLTPYGVTVAA
ncbi:YncE family protein, partial [candidate division WOR-3 bacterium]|nr:YncE family protein [candidate division WOR-3 bacterium]